MGEWVRTQAILMKSGSVYYRVGKYKLIYNADREQPYTVWAGDKVIFFARDKDEALAAVSRDQGSWGANNKVREVEV